MRAITTIVFDALKWLKSRVSKLFKKKHVEKKQKKKPKESKIIKFVDCCVKYTNW